jgi:two-component system sensor kinase FixL
LEVDGLAAALEELAVMAEQRSSIHCRVVCDRRPVIHDHVAEVTLYRIAQEAVANALKHSHATEIAIGLEAVEDEVTLTVSDNGVGFAPPQGHSGMGLQMMRCRAHVIGASLDIRPGPKFGTVVSCFFQNPKIH